MPAVQHGRPRRELGAFVLEGPGGLLAEARKPATRRSIEVTYEWRRLTVEPISSASHVYVLTEGATPRGEVRRRIFPLGRRFEAELAPDLPLPVQLFIAWLVLLLARRRDLAATSWGGDAAGH